MSRVLLLLAWGLPLAAAAWAAAAGANREGPAISADHRAAKGPAAGREHPLKPAVPSAPGLNEKGPLTPRLEVTRMGRLLALDYRLLDGSGTNQVNRDQQPNPPQFIVSQSGREIGSGTFEYG
jgi:hypothetical protein